MIVNIPTPVSLNNGSRFIKHIRGYTMKKTLVISVLLLLGACFMFPAIVEETDGRVSTVEFYSEGKYLGMTYTDEKGYFKLLEPNPTSDTGEFKFWRGSDGGAYFPRPAQYDDTFYTPADLKLNAVFEPFPEEPEGASPLTSIFAVFAICMVVLMGFLCLYHFRRKV